MQTRFMERALELAQLSKDFSGTNPPVGAVIVQNGAIVGEGFHRGPGTPHAEAAALADARDRGNSVAGGTVYVTLEPCCHEGNGKRTPACTRALIAAQVSKVVFAVFDPNPRVSGQGATSLREAGITVETGLLADRAETLLRFFRVSIKEKRPYVTLKWAQSLDGRIACTGGASQWISGEEARRDAHRLRAEHDAVLVGSGTARTDNPRLNVRLCPGRDPLRIVLWGRGALKTDLLLFQEPGKTLSVCSENSPAHRQLQDLGWPHLALTAGSQGHPELSVLLKALYEKGIGSLLVEGGAGVLTSFLKAGFWDQASVFLSPLFLGKGIEALGDLGTPTPAEGVPLKNPQLTTYTDGWRIDGQNQEAEPCSQV